MKTKIKRRKIARCWPASPGIRRQFLNPRHYTHRTGRTAGHALARARLALAAILRSTRVENGLWQEWMPDYVQLPRRAEDLLYVLAHNKGVSATQRGTLLTQLPKLYKVPIHEMHRALATLMVELEKQPSHERFYILPERALLALDEARDKLEAQPL